MTIFMIFQRRAEIQHNNPPEEKGLLRRVGDQPQAILLPFLLLNNIWPHSSKFFTTGYYFLSIVHGSLLIRLRPNSNMVCRCAFERPEGLLQV